MDRRTDPSRQRRPRRAVLITILLAGCAGPRPPPTEQVRVELDLAIEVRDLGQSRISCERAIVESVTVWLDDSFVGTVRIPCFDSFVAPPPAYTLRVATRAGRHRLDVLAAQRSMRASRQIILHRMAHGSVEINEACLTIWLHAGSIRIEPAHEGLCYGLM